MAIYYPAINEIKTTIDNAQPEDIIYLPDQTIDFKISITNECTIRGQENTEINVDGNDSECLYLEGNVDISNLKIQNQQQNGFNGVIAKQFTGEISNFTVSNTDYGIIIKNSEQCNILESKIVNSNIGLHFSDSRYIEVSTIETAQCNIGINFEGSSSIVGDIFASQQFGLNFSNKTDLSGLSRISKTITLNTSSLTGTVNDINSQLGDLANYIEAYEDSGNVGFRVLTGVENTTFILENNIVFGWTAGEYTDHLGTETIGFVSGETFDIIVDTQKEYSIIINGTEYFFTCANHASFASLVSHLNNAKDANDEMLKTFYHVNAINGDIKITSLTPDPLSISPGSKDFLPHLNGFTSLPAVSTASEEDQRDDRSHNIEVVASQAYENKIGVRLFNTDHITFDNCLVYSNEDVGILQNPVSYQNTFNGEVYNNTSYGIRNKDKTHEFIARQTWWGDITGPSMMGPGSGDKVSSGVVFDPWRQDGNDINLSYPATRDWVWRMLGYPLVRVELTEQHISDSIWMAIDRYEEFRVPEQTYYYLNINTGQNVVELPPWMNRKEIMEVTYSPHADLFTQLTGAGESFYLTYYLQQTGGTFLSDFYIAMAYKETLEKVLGIEPAYETFTSKNADGEWRDYIRVSPKPSVSLTIAILYNRPMTEEEVDSSDWIRKYALTWAKEQLGRIRSKYASVPGPTGEMQLDGQQLIQEAQQERQALDESAILRGPPLTFDIG